MSLPQAMITTANRRGIRHYSEAFVKNMNTFFFHCLHKFNKEQQKSTNDPMIPCLRCAAHYVDLISLVNGTLVI